MKPLLMLFSVDIDHELLHFCCHSKLTEELWDAIVKLFLTNKSEVSSDDSVEKVPNELYDHNKDL